MIYVKHQTILRLFALLTILYCQKLSCKHSRMRSKYNSDQMNNELKNAVSWLNVNKLVLNTDKTKCMFFHNPQRIFDPFQVSINNQEIEIVDSLNFWVSQLINI